MRRRALLSTICVVGSGCLGTPSSRNSQSLTSETTTRTSVVTTTQIPGEGVTEYASLSDTGKELFMTMLEGQSIERPSTEIPDQLWEAEHVRYKGQTYSIARSPEHNVSSYTLEVWQVNKSTVDEAKVVQYTGLSTDAKHAFRQALDTGSYNDGSLPEKLTEAQYVEYNQDHYELRVAVGDTRVWRLSVSEKSSQSTS